jgi:hypothetical protein
MKTEKTAADLPALDDAPPAAIGAPTPTLPPAVWPVVTIPEASDPASGAI